MLNACDKAKAMERFLEVSLSDVGQPALAKAEIQQRLQQLPDHVRPLGSQVAGHRDGQFWVQVGSRENFANFTSIGNRAKRRLHRPKMQASSRTNAADTS